jgi:DNA mismatch repair protein MutL
VLFLDIDPSKIDINVHPTKTEIKFEDERLIYNYLKVTLRHSLGQFNVAGVLDFEHDPNLAQISGVTHTMHSSGKDLFSGHTWQQQARSHEKEQIKAWQDMYADLNEKDIRPAAPSDMAGVIEREAFRMGPEEQSGNIHSGVKPGTPFQFQLNYIVHQVKSGLMLIDQQAAHERILYEHFLDQLESGRHSTQKELFPRVVELDPAKSELLKSILQEVNALGFEMSEFGHSSFVIHGTPSGLDKRIPIEKLVEEMTDCYGRNIEFQLGIKENLARSMSASASVKKGRILEKEEMEMITDKLFGCKMPQVSPSGHKCFIIIESAEIIKKFNS